MKKEKGANLLEVLVAFLIIVIAIICVASLFQKSPKITYGLNGAVESRCIEGYKYTVGNGGQARQMLDENGKGIKCVN